MKLIGFIIKKLKSIGAVSLFFLISFGLILLLMKLFLAEYSIKLYALSKIVIGSLTAAKVVIIMDKTPIVRKFRQYPRYVIVLYKTIIYTIAVFVLGILEKILIHHIAIETIIQGRNLNHFLAVNLCVAIVFCIYNILAKIDIYMGKGNLRELFFYRPKTKNTNR